ncbi:hypothetical protein [Kosakonia sp.]|uniref:hypothetical protein n=1 Tax=Kosakonia sp. TaxID=1916651 RepID=UPI0028AD352F|nr:hypothetical protein [Kosakonia sp.]
MAALVCDRKRMMWFVNSSRHASSYQNDAVPGFFWTAILRKRQTARGNQPPHIDGLLLSGRQFHLHPECLCENHNALCGLLA